MSFPVLRYVLAIALLLLCGAKTCAAADEDIPAQIRNFLISPSSLGYENLPIQELRIIYALRDNKPAWKINEDINPVEQAIWDNGLNVYAYPLADLRKLETTTNDTDHAKFDILLTATYLFLAHELHGDTINLSTSYLGWKFHRAAADIPALMGAAINNGSVQDFVTSLVPKGQPYQQLQSALSNYRAYGAHGKWPQIDRGRSIQPQDQSPRVPQLRARLQAEGYEVTAETAADIYDGTLEKAVTAYQFRNGLLPDGHVGADTVVSLNAPIRNRIMQIAANMERWRHMPEDFPPDRYVEVNIADASVVIVENGKEIYRGPVVIGKTDRKTPFIQSRLRSMIVNPSWHVPVDIAQKDILPKLKRDPHYLEKLGFVIADNGNDPYGENIDWQSMSKSDFDFHLRQEPGDMNSLGHLKFDFDNPFAVYMHDTPHHELFVKTQRNFSSGCIRLRDPLQIAEIVLSETLGNWDADKIQKAIDAEDTRYVAITNPIPLYVLYWSVFTDDTGAVNFRKDAYGYDRVLDEQKN